MANIVVSAESIHKQFRPPHQVSSVKSLFTNLFSNKKEHVKPHVVLDGVDLEIRKGEFFGIVGRNGSGKSTLLKILAGIYQPSEGSLKVDGRLVPFIELGVGFNPELTGKDNVYLNGAMLGFSKAEIDKMYDSIVDFAELDEFMGEKLKNYSSGMQVRLAFSMAIRADADILLIDEVLAVGDASFQKKCYDYFFELKEKRKTVIFISHDMSAIKSYCDRVMLLDNGRVAALGDPQAVANKYLELFRDPNKLGHEGLRRWGNGAVRQVDSSVVVADDKIILKTEVSVMDPVDELIYGFQIMSSDGTEVTATNSKMIQQKSVCDLRKGTKLSFQWEIDNIFSSGEYSVNFAYVDENDVALEWVIGAVSFDVVKKLKSATSVLPGIKVVVKGDQ